MDYKVQSVLFLKSKWTETTASDWLLENSYKIKKVDITEKYLRFRQINPDYLKRIGYTHFVNKNIGKGISLIIAYKDGQQGGAVSASNVKRFVEASYKKDADENISDYILDKSLSNDYAKTYYNPKTKQAVVVHRGTSGASDWLNNVAYASGFYNYTNRYKTGKKIQEKASKKYGKENISTLGHSQGAVLSRKLGQDSKEIINLNPAYMGEPISKKEYNIRSSTDLVSGILAPVNTIRSTLYPSYTKNHEITIQSDNPVDVLTEHSPEILNRLEPDRMIGKGILKGGIKSPFCRTGSKYYMRDMIVPLIPPHKIYVELFAGSSAIFFSKEKAVMNVLNDLDKSVINKYKVLVKSPDNLESYNKDLNTKDKIRHFYDHHSNNPQNKLLLEKITSCNGFGSKPVRYANMIYKGSNPYNSLVKHLPEYKELLKGVKLETKDYEKIVDKYDSPDTFFFIDPPYENTNTTFGYAEDKNFDFIRLRKVLDKIKGSFLLTINDSPQVRSLFKGFKLTPVKIQSGFRNAGLGKNSGEFDKVRGELMITNYSPERMKGGTLPNNETGITNYANQLQAEFERNYPTTADDSEKYDYTYYYLNRLDELKETALQYGKIEQVRYVNFIYNQVSGFFEDDVNIREEMFELDGGTRTPEQLSEKIRKRYEERKAREKPFTFSFDDLEEFEVELQATRQGLRMSGMSEPEINEIIADLRKKQEKMYMEFLLKKEQEQEQEPPELTQAEMMELYRQQYGSDSEESESDTEYQGGVIAIDDSEDDEWFGAGTGTSRVAPEEPRRRQVDIDVVNQQHEYDMNRGRERSAELASRTPEQRTEIQRTNRILSRDPQNLMRQELELQEELENIPILQVGLENTGADVALEIEDDERELRDNIITSQHRRTLQTRIRTNRTRYNEILQEYVRLEERRNEIRRIIPNLREQIRNIYGVERNTEPQPNPPPAYLNI